MTECLVVKRGPGVELLPQRQRRDVNRPEYGLPLVARGAQVRELLPGERVAVRLAD
jgi:hypothetical protein